VIALRSIRAIDPFFMLHSITARADLHPMSASSGMMLPCNTGVRKPEE
jgi:hypothetical protein